MSAWTAPDNPDPRRILDEARSDRVAGRYDDALRKHLWFHKEALRYEPAMCGVRRSFALGDWGNLAHKHPPALAALRKLRGEAAEDIAAGRDVEEAFHDAAAIDRELEEPAETQRTFHVLAARDPGLARRVYSSAHDALVEMGDFAACAKYVDADRQLEPALRAHRGIAEREASFPDMQGYADRFLANQAGTLVAVLAIANRRDEALRIAEKARAATTSTDAHAVIARALEGEVPPPLVSRESKAQLRAVMP